MVEPQVIEIHTSDRQTFKRCRRKFGWSSTLRDNLIRIGPDHKAFFLGTGFHFALEDWFGYRRFAHPALAFAAYYDAQKAIDLPDEAEEALELATGMLSYYVEDWLEEHPDEYETLWVDGVPQVEVEVAINITDLLLEGADHRGLPAVWLEHVLNRREVHYITTFDRVVIDRHARLFGLDYKTAAQFDELNLLTNPQAGAYDWSMDLFYTPVGYKPEGIIWQQHKKTVPELPKLVNAGKANEGLSLDIRQATTYRLYKKAVIAQHGTITDRYLGILADLGNAQGYEGDRFIRRETLRRNQKQREAEQEKIIQEVLEMLDPNLPLYPNMTKDCSWDCSYRDPCLVKDDGGDYQYILDHEYERWHGYKDAWRGRIKWPS
jgi:hypothetical protein